MLVADSEQRFPGASDGQSAINHYTFGLESMARAEEAPDASGFALSLDMSCVRHLRALA